MPKQLLWIFSLLVYLNLVSTVTLPCKPKDFGNGGTVCVCDETYCDYVGPLGRPPVGNYWVYTSNLAGKRLTQTEGTFVENILDDIDNSEHLGKSKKKKVYKRWKKLLNLKRHGHEVVLNVDKSYQQIFGFGGAFTDAAGYNIYSLTEKLQTDVFRSYYSDDGIQYNVGRVPIGGTDFSPYAYSYDDGKEDKNLTNFALKDMDYKYKIPLVNAAKKLRPDIQLYASAWTAPKWMKTNNNYVGGTIKPDMYQSWANYYLKFLEAYDNNGIQFWGITTGNEPSLALFPLVLVGISTVGWTPSELAKWVSQNLGPTIRNSTYKDIKIMALDDQRLFLYGLYSVLNGSTNATKYIDGIAVHWYLDQYVSPSILTWAHNTFPDKFILYTEASEGATMVNKGVKLGDWSRAEDYATDIIEDLNNWVIGWVDWNIALNMTGGPTYLNNVVDSPIIVDAANKVFYKNPMFYALGQFSKFFSRGSVRVDLTSHPSLQTVAVQRPDDGVAIAILNKNNRTVPLTITRPGNGSIILNVTPRSITTIVYW